MVCPQLPPKIEYHLTARGHSLLPVIRAMTQRGEEHRATVEPLLTKLPEIPAPEVSDRAVALP